jgi:hypothetical protein
MARGLFSVCGFVVILSQISVAIKITPLTLANSVIHVEGVTKCVPASYHFVRARIRFGELFRKMHNDLNVVKATMGHYGAQGDPYAFRKYRECDAVHKSSGYCSLASVINMTGHPAGKSRYQIIAMHTSLDTKLANLMSLWNTFPKSFQSPLHLFTNHDLEAHEHWPWGDQDSRTISHSQWDHHTFYPKVGDEVIKNLAFLTDLTLKERQDRDKTKEVVLPENITEPVFEMTLLQLAEQMQTAEDQLEAILSMTRHQLEKGYFPITLFPYEDWILTWYGIGNTTLVAEVDEEKVRMAKQFISLLPLTTVKRKVGCDSYNKLDTVMEDCILDIITIVPGVKTMKEFAKIEFTAHPVPKNAMDPETKWRKIVLPQGIEVYRSNETYFSLDHQLQCFSSIPNEACQLCSTSHAFEKLTDRCLLQVIKDSVTEPPCTALEVEEHESMQRIRDHARRTDNGTTGTHDLIITNNKPTMIIEACPDKESSYELPLAVRVQIGAKCTFKMINAPILHSLIPGLNYTTITDFNLTIPPKIVEKIKETKDQLREHFEDHSHIYVIVLAAITVVNFLACACYFICRQGCMKIRYSQTSEDADRQVPHNELQHARPHVPLMHAVV